MTDRPDPKQNPTREEIEEDLPVLDRKGGFPSTRARYAALAEEVERLRVDVEGWKNAATAEANLRREKEAECERLKGELADIDVLFPSGGPSRYEVVRDTVARAATGDALCRQQAETIRELAKGSNGLIDALDRQHTLANGAAKVQAWIDHLNETLSRLDKEEGS